MDIYVKDIDKNNKRTRRTIYEAIDAHHFGNAELFTKAFLDNCKKHLKDPQKNTIEIKKNKLKPLIRNYRCAGGYGLLEWCVSEEKCRKNLKSCFKDSLQDCIVDLILILSA